MKHPTRSLLIAAVPLVGIGLVAMAASAGSKKTCRDLLWDATYQCEVVVEGQQASKPMWLFFSGPEFGGPEIGGVGYAGPEPGLSMGWTGPEFGSGSGWCACKTGAGKLKRPDKVKFQQKKDFHCMMQSGADALAGSEFDPSFASVEGQVRGKRIKKGEAVDVYGRTVAFGCNKWEGP